MIESNPSHSAIDRRSFERLINFTDAVAAIAITLQLLPLIDIKAKKGETILSLFQSNSSQVFAFGVSFFVVLILWLKHNQVFNVMKRFDGKIFWLNAVWLILIVFLPWPTALYGAINDAQSASGRGIGLLYWWTMAAICAVGWMIARHAWHHQELLEDSIRSAQHPDEQENNFRGLGFFIVFFLFGVASELAPQTVPYLSLSMLPLGLVFRKKKKRQRTRES